MLTSGHFVHHVLRMLSTVPQSAIRDRLIWQGNSASSHREFLVTHTHSPMATLRLTKARHGSVSRRLAATDTMPAPGYYLYFEAINGKISNTNARRAGPATGSLTGSDFAVAFGVGFGAYV